MKSLFTLSLLSIFLLANEALDFEADFLSSIDEISEIATKTKLNIDDVPSFVTILQSNKLQKLGINTVFEALSQVPGVQTTREASGVPVVIFRGVSQKGEVKLMLDGVTINNTYRGSIYHYLEFPLELVERIEVIRGASSVLYGSGAISGVINIITKSSNKNSRSTLFVAGGSYDAYKGGALLSQDISTFHLALDAYYEENSKQIKTIDEHLNNYSFGLRFFDEHLSLNARITEAKAGNAYGVLGVADQDIENLGKRNNTFFSELSYKNNISKKNSFQVLAGYSRYAQTIDDAHPSIPVIKAEFTEESYYTSADFTTKVIPDNELLLGVRYEHASTLKSEVSPSAVPPFSNPDFSRDTFSVYLNDQYALAQIADISLGLRYDDYSDFGNSFSPNFGLVYRVNQSIRIKTQYSHAFRAPSWVELTSNATLQAEKSDTLELGVVFKREHNQNTTLRFNVYMSQIDDLITKDSVNKKYIQNSTNKFYGAELELNYTPYSDLELNFLASYVDAKDTDANKIPNIAHTLASTSLHYNLDMGFDIGSLLKYINTDEPSPSLIFDQSLSYAYKDFTFEVIVKDLFNGGTYYALPIGSSANEYYAGGRNILLKANMEF